MQIRLVVAGVMCGLALLTFAGGSPAPALEGDYEAAVTRIPCKLTERLSSQDARGGDRFAFDTTSSVEINRLFLPAGTHGHGFVLEAQAARGSQPGSLTVEARSLDLPGGQAIPVGLEPGQLDRRLQRFGGALPAGSGPLGGGLRETNVIYEKGTAFTVTAPPPATPAPAASP